MRADQVIVVAGVSGSGKTTLGLELARRLRCAFCEGDDLHSPANRARMAAGIPLTDADRAPWLDRIADWIAARARAGEQGVVSCSALRRVYRDRLREAGGDALRFVLLLSDETTLLGRLERRAGHFMPATLLASQLTTLERPEPGEDVLILVSDRPADMLAGSVLEWLAQG